MKASSRRFLDRTVHPLDLTVGPGVEPPCQAHISPNGWLVELYSGAFGKLCAVIRDTVWTVRQLPQRIFEKLGCLISLCLTIQPSINELRSLINGYKNEYYLFSPSLRSRSILGSGSFS